MLSMLSMLGCACGSGAAAKGPSDLSSAVGTTTLSSDTMLLPDSRMPVASGTEETEPAPQTWGAAAEAEAPKAPAEAAASDPFDRI